MISPLPTSRPSESEKTQREAQGPWASRDIVSGHPEIEIYEKEIRRAVESPTTVLAGREPDEEWLYLEGAGPSRWLKVVVSFDSEVRGPIITSFARGRES